MYAIALTSIPPRLPRLAPVLAHLLAQRPAPARVLLCLPRRWQRFDTSPDLPDLPPGVEVIRGGTDMGPATKAIVPARALAGRIKHLIYCDDDWLMPPGWAAALLAAARPGRAVAASGVAVSRLKRRSHRTGPRDGDADIAQGYAGVLVDPAWLCPPDIAPPTVAWPVDDIWLSGQLARQGIGLRLAPDARAGMRLAFTDDHALQDAVIGGRRRHAANLACCDLLTERYGLWPPQGMT